MSIVFTVNYYLYKYNVSHLFQVQGVLEILKIVRPQRISLCGIVTTHYTMLPLFLSLRASRVRVAMFSNYDHKSIILSVISDLYY